MYGTELQTDDFLFFRLNIFFDSFFFLLFVIFSKKSKICLARKRMMWTFYKVFSLIFLYRALYRFFFWLIEGIRNWTLNFHSKALPHHAPHLIIFAIWSVFTYFSLLLQTNIHSRCKLTDADSFYSQ